MSRVEPLFMGKGNGGFADGIQTEVMHLIKGGNFGYAKNWETWINGTPYVSRPLLTFLMETPLGFKLLPEAQTHISILRSLVETVRHRVEGLTHKLNVNKESNVAFGGSGQKFDVFSNVTEDQPTVSFSWWERPGLAINRFMNFWITMLMMDAETKYAAISTVAGTEAYDALPDMYSMSVLFVEPNSTHTKVVQSWLGINMWPTATGDNSRSSDKENPGSLQEITIEFSGIFMYGPSVDNLSQKVLNSISLINANVYHSKTVLSGIDAMVANSPESYSQSVRAISAAQYR